MVKGALYRILDSWNYPQATGTPPYDQRAIIWGDLVANAARFYRLDLHRLHADTMAMTFAGLFTDQPAVARVPRLELGCRMFYPVLAKSSAVFVSGF